jgi:hypothetical protein
VLACPRQGQRLGRKRGPGCSERVERVGASGVLCIA